MLSQGDSDSHLLLLLNGEFSVFYKCRVNLTTVAMNIGNFLVRHWEVNLVLQASRTATVVSRTEADYLFLDPAYNQIIQDHPRIAIKIVTNIASLIQTVLRNLANHVSKLDQGKSQPLSRHQQARVGWASGP